jgi:hypothetical protein
MGDTSVEDIYKEAERREKDMDVDQLPPTGSTPSSPPGTGDQTAALGNQLDDPDEAASKALQECYKKFLASHSNKTVNVTDVPVNCVDSAQNGIKNLRIKNLGTQNLDIGFEKITVDLDGFKLSSKAWGKPFFVRHNFGVRQTIGLSFNEQTLMCGNCNSGHRILSGRGGAG